MTNYWKVLATFLLCTLAVVAWAGAAELERMEVPPGVNDNGFLLDVRGVFESKELKDQLVVLYQDPTEGSFGYSLQEGPTTGEDVLDFGDLKLAVTFADDGGLKTVEVWENDTWSTVGEFDGQVLKKGNRPKPPFIQVPMAPIPCEGGVFRGSAWVAGCLIDNFDCPGGRVGRSIACCDKTTGMLLHPSCQDYGVPLPTAN